jgi:GH15 family glucan-1,4-alpha-glucosidase
MAAESIEDHAIIGDCRAAALVSRSGAIDWLCWPRFDSTPLFAAILDPRAGFWTLRPPDFKRSTREYEKDTNVLRTRFKTESGTLLVTDFMPVCSEEEKRTLLSPSHEIIRIAECETGEVRLETEFAPAPDFGRGRIRPRPAGRLGLRLQTDQGMLTLRSDMDLVWDGARALGAATLRAGESRRFSLSLAVVWPEVYSPLEPWCSAALERSLSWWRSWSSRARYDGPARDAVIRSALTIRLMLHAPTGAIIAAPTTSLPERPGGASNWDYRYCWPRDASMTVRAFLGLGFFEEAEAFVNWLIHSTRLSRSCLDVLYDVYGNKPQKEEIIPNLEGHLGSRPVRVGNAAVEQLQLDIYGEVIQAAADLIIHRGGTDDETGAMLCDLGEYVCRHWREPDEGIWEPRSGRAQRTHSKVLCWAAMDGLLELHDKGFLPGAPAARFAAERIAIRREVEEKAWDPGLESYVPVFGEDGVDASLLLLTWHDFEPASSPRMRGTYARIRARLDAGDGLLYRKDVKVGVEGAFGICGFWGAEFLALGGGSAADARATFERLVGHANDVGLFAEEIDPKTKTALGNFPQAFTHVGLINAALSLEQRLKSGKKLEST